MPDMLNGDDHYAYVVGYSDGTVRPNANISRAEVATIFFRLLKKEVRDGNLTTENTFADVTDGQWHNKAISTMAKLDIVKGRRADSFDPDASITRAEFAAICARFNTKPVENSGSFSDISGHWAENEIERAAAFGWISGYPDGTFRPDARITRAEAMTMINRVLCRMPQSESNLLDSMVTWPDNKPSDWHYLAVQEATNSHDFDRQGEVGESWTKLTSVPDWKQYQK
ncbi:S-layer homology domain-containing protein [Butyricicoccus sp. AF10-3]|nr:S-layer homology domain-containing protein [Butyricicoccus sp. AF10-3]